MLLGPAMRTFISEPLETCTLLMFGLYILRCRVYRVSAGPFPYESNLISSAIQFGISSSRDFDGTSVHQPTQTDWAAGFVEHSSSAGDHKATAWVRTWFHPPPWCLVDHGSHLSLLASDWPVIRWGIMVSLGFSIGYGAILHGIQHYDKLSCARLAVYDFRLFECHTSVYQWPGVYHCVQWGFIKLWRFMYVWSSVLSLSTAERVPDKWS